ncbi:MAG: dihydroflavonol-4-reductase [Chitinophagaceae bacterium]|nr:dihydroflavonol-4-reductase [Chitinophagaceae bacterium]
MILVTGGTGLIGSHLIKALLLQDTPVSALYRKTIPEFEGFEKVEWIKGDILDPGSLTGAMRNKRQVYHCAAMVSFHPSQKEELLSVNVQGTANVVNTALDAGIDKLLFVSSVAAIGRIREDGPINENMQWSPKTNNSEYGRSKYLAEMEVWRAIGEGLKAVIVNPVMVLGESDWNNSSTALFKSAYNEFAWYTEGVSGFVDVADVVKAMILLMNSDIEAQRFILSAENISFRQLFTMMATAFDKKPPYKKVTPVLAEIVWRAEAIKAKMTGKKPLLTKETARTAQAKVYFDNSKFLKLFPSFQYSPVSESIGIICRQLIERHN